MRIGFSLPQLGGVAARQADAVARFAGEAEALGAGSLWVGDRLLAPVNPTVGYPPGASTIPEEFHHILDPFVALGIAAAVTEKPLLGTNVINAPWYPPALLARSLTTIDAVSGGRLVPGFGSGWSPEEFQAASVPFAERGRRLDECLDALDQLWTADPAEYHGQHWTVPATHAGLKPVRRPQIHLAGFAPAALRRVARRADGWLPILVLPGPTDPAELITAPMRRIREFAEQEGRDPAGIGLVLRVYPQPGATIDEVVSAIQRCSTEPDVRHLLVDLMFLATSVDHALELAETILRSC
ncbi:TIGR03619 family F420-dependent LLM class oxidoreductase [Solihabitans fulvus]|uniref:TIGR03619 family F420-dependent LLM class oxidoreductase n=1 Tax=Solihabitans fulvus TaxID=1892852 RepID=A0A5B2WUX7_9PSEU|nr:TIGR03619 family F420-dependent LLM class oxidoreductase [Solihabitans fulvus]KAA2255355.1 TIGR03619 family F420-dependent LLM class oxidoreductase [Solihabitans fulvus]